MPPPLSTAGCPPLAAQAAPPDQRSTAPQRRAVGQAARSCLPTLPPPRAPSRWAGALLAVGVLSVWAALFAGAAASTSWVAKLALALGCGTAAGLLVILGHDAAHGALTPWRTVNALLARLLFLPPWQTASGWQQAHREHHAFTNLKTHDDGYPPPSPADWRAMSPWRRGFWRFKHTLPGLFLFYLDVWWRRVIWPRRPDLGRARVFRADSALVLGFIAAQVAMVLGFGGWQQPTELPRALPASTAGLLEVVVVVLLPFVACNWWVSAITLQQHRHPDLRWFDTLAAWQRGHDLVSGTVHLAWPRPAPWLLFNIFEHTAHHVDPQRPFTLLGPAQQRLADSMAGQVIVVEDRQPWRLRYLRHVLAHCQVHDYDSGRWSRFDEVDEAAGERA
jgi:acyl-lipid omega-6 desaturase (Delta-12 desaturase)